MKERRSKRASAAMSVICGLMLLARTSAAQGGGEEVESVTTTNRDARDERARRELLTAFVGEHVRRENFGETLGYVMAGLGLLVGIQGTAVLQEDKPLGATWVVTSAVSTTAVATSLFLSRDTRVGVLQVNSWMLAGGVALGAAVSEDAGSVHPLTNLGLAGAAFTYGGLKAINLASRRTSLGVLRRHRDRLNEGRASNAELAGIERDFRGTDEPISYQVLAVPLALGAGVALVPAFDETSSQTEKTWSLVGGGVLGLTCVFSLVTVNLVPAYEENLGIVGLEILAGPTEINAVLRF